MPANESVHAHVTEGKSNLRMSKLCFSTLIGSIDIKLQEIKLQECDAISDCHKLNTCKALNKHGAIVLTMLSASIRDRIQYTVQYESL